MRKLIVSNFPALSDLQALRLTYRPACSPLKVPFPVSSRTGAPRSTGGQRPLLSTWLIDDPVNG
jgi:hypothetical protein